MAKEKTEEKHKIETALAHFLLPAHFTRPYYPSSLCVIRWQKVVAAVGGRVEHGTGRGAGHSMVVDGAAAAAAAAAAKELVRVVVANLEDYWRGWRRRWID